MATHPANKYHLKDVHREIDYLDRRIAYSESLEKFASEDERKNAIKKLVTKRGTLVKAAAELVNQGVEWDAKDLPRSFSNRTETAVSEPATELLRVREDEC